MLCLSSHQSWSTVTLNSIPEPMTYFIARNITNLGSFITQLEKEVEYTEAISPVCLPQLGARPEVDTKCYAIGWGHTECKIIFFLYPPMTPSHHLSCANRLVIIHNSSTFLSKILTSKILKIVCTMYLNLNFLINS